MATKNIEFEVVDTNNRWFGYSIEILKHIITEWKDSLYESKFVEGEDECIKHHCRDARSNAKNNVEIEKGW